MDHAQFYRTRLPGHLDRFGDIAPPWERFPDYERYTIGWRMGDGEGWLSRWHVFLEDLDPAPAVRLAYLRRHRPAPITWADAVYETLHPSGRESEDRIEVTPERRAALLEAGLIGSDVAFGTWLAQQERVRWPWESGRTPEDVARYGTRNLWFWSRQVAGLRNDPGWTPPPVPGAWRSCAEPLATGNSSFVDTRRGLTALARMLAAGNVVPPWRLGSSRDDFADSFEMDMGYVDAFRLWGMSAFDDREQLRAYLDATEAPKEWEAWVAGQSFVD